MSASDEVLTVLEFHGHPEGEWCDDPLCYQRPQDGEREPNAPVMAIGGQSNADLIEACYQLGYIRDSDHVLDPTYGMGRWWAKRRPDELAMCDINEDRVPSGISIDFRELPFMGDVFDVVAFDPPYKLCLDDATLILTQRGWLSCDEVEVGDETYALDHETGLAHWRTITAVNIYDAEPTTIHAIKGKALDIVATPEHSWPVITACGVRRWRSTDSLAASDRMILAAPDGDMPTDAVWDDALVELIGWLWTEGHVGDGSTYATITQSHAVNTHNCARIARCLEKLYGPPVEFFERTGRTSVPAWRIKDEERNRRFILSAAVGADLLAIAPGRIPTLDWLLSLTAEQLELFIETSTTADGQSPRLLAQKNPLGAHAFALACLLSGRAVSLRNHHDGNGDVVRMRHGSARPLRNAPVVETRNVRVWCPTVDGLHSWLANRNGRVYFTGNSGTPSSAGAGALNEGYGITRYESIASRHDLIRAGMTECTRVLKMGGILLLKCQDQASSGHVRWQTKEFWLHASTINLDLIDEFHLPSYRAQPEGRRQLHARRNFSTLQVYRKVG